MAAMSLQRKMRIVIISLLLLIMVCIYGCEGESQQAVSDNVQSSEVE